MIEASPTSAAAPTAPPEVVAAPRPGPAELVSPAAWLWLRVGLVLACLSPVTLLLGLRLAHLRVDPLLGIYGVVVLTTTSVVMFVAFAFYRDPATAPAPAAGERPLVSVLMACRDDLDIVERCVVSVLASSYRPLELIVVDDGSTDGSRELLIELVEASAGFRLILNDESVGKKRALVRGAERAHGDIFVFTDSDCVLDRDAIGQLVRAFQADPALGGVSGHARALNGDRNLLTRVQDVWYDGQFGVWKAAESVFGAVSCVSGPLAGFRREAILNYLPAWAEDSFLGQEFRFATDRQLTGYVLGQMQIGERLKERHRAHPLVRDVDHPPRPWRVCYVRSAQVWTAVPHTLGRLFRQQARWKKSFIRNLFFTGTFYWRRGPVPAGLFYSHALFVMATPVMAARHLVYLPLRGAWFLCALYLCGIGVKGSIWAVAYRVQNPGDGRWVYRPLMSLMSAALFSMLLVYSSLTLRSQVWARG